MGMKGVVTIFELLLVILILIAAFTVFFPKFSYESKWDDAILFLKGRDAVLTMDRIEKLYENSFNFSSLQNFLGRIFPKEPLVFLPAVEGTIKSRIQVACNCTDEEKRILSDWLSGPKGKAILRINDRDINFDVCITHLEALNPCLTEFTDVLVIWGKKRLNSKHKDLLKSHLERGNGIVEIRDFSNQDEIELDDVQREIFGLRWGSPQPTSLPDYDEFREKPKSVEEITYIPWKYFYHIPINLEANSTGGGNFTFRQNSYIFQIINSTSIFLNNQIIRVNESFQLGGYNFYLSYIKGMDSIGISFKPTYNFTDFLRVDSSAYNVQPRDGNLSRVLLVAKPQNLPVVILNVTPISRVAWIANFTEHGVGDDERLLFISLLLWASNQRKFWLRPIEEIAKYVRIVYSTSYVNVKNKDIFEVYKFRLGIGYSYK
jgi:hypothetical protein